MNATNLRTAIVRLAANAATIALVPPFAAKRASPLEVYLRWTRKPPGARVRKEHRTCWGPAPAPRQGRRRYVTIECDVADTGRRLC